MKNYMCLLLFCIFACFFAFEPVGANFPLSGRVFVIDAGHGGYLYTRCNKTSEKAL